FGREKTDVLVVGAGPVGLFTALHLARHGVRVQIVDKEWRTGAHSYALALHAASLRLLDDLGLRARVLEHAYRVDTVAFYDGPARRAAAGLAVPDGEGVAVVRQDVLEDVLEAALREAGVTVRW